MSGQVNLFRRAGEEASGGGSVPARLLIDLMSLGVETICFLRLIL